jgi:hypothetical protein
MSDGPSCSWCNRPFRMRQGGGRAQRFCRPSCRRAAEFLGGFFAAQILARISREAFCWAASSAGA